ncbi:hypothetical protein C5C18_11875 [Rathayibacter tritici]|uniref:hypothetical protein n=1 Tax=Rathayibacter tritici TaxID=33888 RepID=UPI000CE8CE27|nr:hypothetical protein [Rathayibacter tritici]PPF28045.1 hypothetical protein C5C06_08585 [Rathayibacter tritici]PPF66157.1 hypothetical protein C5C21_09720 [Rathayibacter tritici]PPF66180.1 hypothetical protein C5C21_09840 [Rathayibacter tritici]PPG05956.1 hypothetical protein C5C18_11760 [Rathayibacter tritici]PPG05978.1 hypothetical protein C5C18_11875 [Rathayibacter tritici]
MPAVLGAGALWLLLQDVAGAPVAGGDPFGFLARVGGSAFPWVFPVLLTGATAVSVVQLLAARYGIRRSDR